MASRLAPCPSCSRHVKVGPPSCPFCGGDVPTEVAARFLNIAPGAPLTRAALLFAGAAAVTACSSSSSGPTNPPTDAAIDMGHVMALYGVIVDDGGDDDGGQGNPMPAYGVVAFRDASDDAGEEDDSGTDNDGQAVAAYGVMADPDGGVK